MQCYWIIAFPKNYFIDLIWNFQIDIVLEYYYAITTALSTLQIYRLLAIGYNTLSISSNGLLEYKKKNSTDTNIILHFSLLL